MSRVSVNRSWRSFVLGSAGVATFLALLEFIPDRHVIDPEYLPPTSVIFSSLWSLVHGEVFWSALGNTLLTWGAGLAIVTVSGGVLGTLVGSVPLLRNVTNSTVEFLRPIPSVALVPVVILLLGTGRAATLLLVVYASFWQIYIQVIYGVHEVDPVARDTAAVYHFGTGRIVRDLIWPTVLPYAMTGFRLAAAVALMLTITGELLIGTDGLGRSIVLAESGGDVPTMYALIFVTGILGLLVNLVVRRFERWALRWHVSVRSELA
ncbi:ABC-type nitrate/sulfonate/bicarbonate transport system permease component [Methylovirgula ligni]|uniref:ABC-type nitrate/sulfonate/bicarbonate transport system permease component n=1 Tax=Methylovirgula ligni TaxID=569860 RepID=A0A3D9YXH2_9HYPH|nr:ABC transporter permease [Methylovirgula ligni]REF86283.1 ABC-type nitrate/sulfonate/bicarbonate transport system permease component [Methylovirgula ligni]